MHTDPEVIWFLISVAIMVVVGVPRSDRTVWVPSEVEFQEVPNAQLTPAQAGFLNSYDDKLALLQYQPFKTFRVPDMIGHNLIRVYLSSTDPAKCAIRAVGSKNKSRFVSFIEFVTGYADGARLGISNNETTGLVEEMPAVTTS